MVFSRGEWPFAPTVDVGVGLGAINRGLLAVVVAGVFGLAGAVPRGVRVQVPDPCLHR